MSHTTRVFLVGAGGMLGYSVYKEFIQGGYRTFATDIDMNEDWISYGDIRDSHLMRTLVMAFSPNAIINLAALTDLEYCESNEAAARETNAIGAGHLGVIARDVSADYVYVSTAGVFDGKRDYYVEEDQPNPVCAYGRTKYEGERLTMEATERHYILRAGWMMGGGRKDKKFIGLLYKQICQGKTLLHVVHDKSGTPTYTREFARKLRLLLECKAPYGIYHLAASGKTSRIELTREFLRMIGREDIKVEPVASEFFRERFFAPRPTCEAIVDTKLRKACIPEMRNWRECLQEYVREGSFHEAGL